MLGEKQDPSSTHKVYTNNIEKAKKLFEILLIKEGRLSYILSPKFDCLLYLSKDQQDKFKKIILPDTNFPEGLLNEAESDCVSEFERKMNKTSSVDLVDLILKVKSSEVATISVERPTKTTNLNSVFEFFNVANDGLVKWAKYFKELKN